MKIKQTNTRTTAGKAAVMQAASAGKKVAAKAMDSTGPYLECMSVGWDWERFDYQIIAEPVGPNGPDEVWVAMESGDHFSSYKDEESAQWVARTWGGSPIRYVRPSNE